MAYLHSHRYVAACVIALGLCLSQSARAWDWFSPEANWAEWQGFKHAFITNDGRVVDHSQDDKRTVSEGQAYAMFFALVANDKETFDKLLQWTENNLSKGDITKTLPAWHWGKRDGGWGVTDSNSASDADLLFAYILLEASRLWCQPKYEKQAKGLGETIQQDEVIRVNGLGRTLLPGKVGFVADDGKVKLNPSYVPPFVLSRLSSAWADDQRWAELYLGSQQLLFSGQKGGLYPDWLWMESGQVSDLSHPGDYDAIRVYLWLGISNPNTPTQSALISAVSPFLDGIGKLGYVPEQWHPHENEIANTVGPAGFQFALRPLVKLRRPNMKPPTLPTLPGANNTDGWREYGYYNAALTLFAKGYLDGYYQIGPLGQLNTKAIPKGGKCE